MLLSFKKNASDSQAGAANKAAPSVPSYADFIPYYSHYNSHTLLTKNGEVMQIIKIAADARGVEYEGSDAMGLTLRDVLRTAIIENVNGAEFSIWLHTIRRRKQVNFTTRFQEKFAAYVHRSWAKKQKWNHQYYNEVYLTILHEGQAAPLTEKEALKQVVLPMSNRAYRNAYLDKAAQHLDTVVSGILAQLRTNYSAQLLGTVERLPTEIDPLATRPIFYSEPMEFLGTLLNLQAEPHPLPDADISVALQTHDLTFGYNAMETKNVDGKRKFGALLTLKRYSEMAPEMVDVALQAPLELIVSQSFHFISEKEALWEYRNQHDIFRISGDDYSIRAAGVEEMLQNANTPLAYGSQQTSIIVIADEYKLLNTEVIDAQAAFAKLGLITVREDIKLEECFWSALPGNFVFLRRATPILTRQIGGFCRLNRFPGGRAVGNHWGDAVTLMPTIVNSPYYFNFHYRYSGHSVLFDYNSFNDSNANTLLHFLLSETRQYLGKLFVFDRGASAELLFDKLGGHYHYFARNPDKPKRKILPLNPFWLEDSPRNRGFLLAWCGALVEEQIALTETHKETLRQAIAQVYCNLPEGRNLSHLVAEVARSNNELAEAFSPWLERGAFADIFSSGAEQFNISKPMHGFDMGPIVEHPESIIPVVSYLLHRIVTTLDGKPSIIVMRDAWDLLENPFFAPRLESLLEMLEQSNAIVIFTARNPQERVGTHIFDTIMRLCPTQIYLPDDIAVNYESVPLGLTPQDARILTRMDRQKGEFLLKQKNETVGLRTDMTGLDDLQAIFSNNIKNLIAAGGEYASLPDK
ncbi:MAG: hypothetical protein EBR02_07765 [Alphaproteobacteria bacterium]|nr:hypothetical protein [Alphaproteobacteria bacterium]